MTAGPWVGCWGHRAQLDMAPAVEELSTSADLRGPGPLGVLYCQTNWSVTVISVCAFMSSALQLLPKTMAHPARCAHPEEVGSQAAAQPVHDVEEQKTANGVEELTWGKDRAGDSPSP